MTGYVEGRIQRFYEAGTVIFKEGDPGASMYILTSGEVEVSTEKDGEKVVLANLSKGAIFGEMALIDQPYRSATVTATTDVTCLEINNIFFANAFKNLPSWMKSFFQIIVERLKEANKKIEPLTKEDKVRQVIFGIGILKDLPEIQAETTNCFKLFPMIKILRLFTNLPGRIIEVLLERLIEEEIFKKIVDFKEGNLIKVVDQEKFSAFADYCRTQLMYKMGFHDESPNHFLSPQKYKVLKFLAQIMREQQDKREIAERYLDTKCQAVLGCKWTELRDIELGLMENKILKVERVDENGKHYLVDRFMILDLLEKEERFKQFQALEKELVYAWELFIKEHKQ